MKKIHYSDFLEKIVGEALSDAGIKFFHDSASEIPNQRLDFYLPDYGIYIEIKQYHSDRICEQMSLHNNIIVLQGKESVNLFIALIKRIPI